jgi:hypothetical protein
VGIVWNFRIDAGGVRQGRKRAKFFFARNRQCLCGFHTLRREFCAKVEWEGLRERFGLCYKRKVSKGRCCRQRMRDVLNPAEEVGI